MDLCGQRQPSESEKSIFVTTTALDTPAKPWATANFQRLRRSGCSGLGRGFVLAEDPGEADFIVFVDSADYYLADVRRSRLYRRYRHKCFVLNHNDDAIPVLPGIYPDLAAPLRRPDIQLGGFYLRSFDNRLLASASAGRPPRFLFSFVGNSRTAPAVREKILGLRHADAFLADRSSGLRDDDLSYVEIMQASKFVICPRGLGPTSWRFYETMMAGRVPIIVSDRWVAARELDWPAFSLRVAESAVESIPEICEQYSARAEEMGAVARAEWERCCSKRQAFAWVGRRLVEMAGHARGAPRAELVRELLFRGELLRFVRRRLGVAVRSLSTQVAWGRNQ